MSLIKSHLERIINNRNKIRAKFISLGLAAEDATLDELANATENIKVVQSNTIVPSTEDIVISNGSYLAGKQLIKGDANLVPENIISGTSIFGVEGSASWERDVLVNTRKMIDRSITEIIDNEIDTVGMYAFATCNQLSEVHLNAVTMVSGYGFSSCTSLTELSLPVATYISSWAFRDCVSLKDVNLPCVTSLGGYTFDGCSAVEKLDFPSLTRISTYDFNNCSKLSTLILRSNTIASLASTNAFYLTPITAGTGYIYVPRDLVDSYKNATNWSSFADQIRAIEDYPDITGG